ncbi:MAG: HEAT repeat domain-containing protein [Planctomycetes bacterium]|nr:HEAT repeat domain-containing protein [Planctomycetota bacterium]
MFRIMKVRTSLRIWIAAAAAMLALTAGPAFAASAAADGDEDALIAVLKDSDASLFDKAKACQQLAVIGTAKAVPALKALLSDEKLGHYARFGLEPIPDPSVDDALRAALKTLKGGLLIGAIDSIGWRRDAKALAALSQFLGDPSPAVAGAAAAAVGRIGTPVAARILKTGVTAAPAALRPAIADACFQCAEALLAVEEREEAIAIYDAVRKANLAEHLLLAATRGAILARGPAGAPLLIETLKSPDYAYFTIGLRLIRELPGTEVTGALIGPDLAELPPEKLALVIQALGDRGDRNAQPALIEATKSSQPAVRIAAIRALEQIGGEEAVPDLLAAASDSDANVAAAALDTLASLRGKDVDRAIGKRLEGGDLTLPLIELVGKRRASAAVPALRKAAGSDDEKIRHAAIGALGSTVDLDGIAILTTWLVNPMAPQDRSVVQEALRAACVRMPDRDACADELIQAMGQAPADGKPLILEVFSAVGGAKALASASAFVTDANPKIAETAAQVLGDWKTEDGAKALLALFKEAANPDVGIRAASGLKRIILGLGFPNDRKLALCKEALGAARSDGERKLILEALAGAPSAETLALLTTYVSTPNIKEAACASAVTVAERIVRNQPNAVAEAMKQVVQSTENNDISARAQRLLRRATPKS